MSLTFERWPFEPPEARLPEDEERWWAECYLPHPVEQIVESHSQWCVLIGGYQCGKSTALAALQRKSRGRALVMIEDYLMRAEPFQGGRVPPDEQATPNILWRILSRAALLWRKHLGEQPALVSSLSSTQKEFLRWSIQKFHGERAFLRWLDTLPRETTQLMGDIEFKEIYPSPLQDTEGQIEELLSLSKRLGYPCVLVLVDTPPILSERQKQEIHQLLGWLEPMQHPGLKLVLALPPTFSPKEIHILARGRATVLHMETSREQTQEIIARHLSAATKGEAPRLEQWCAPDLMASLEGLVQAEFGASAPGGWLKIVEILLEMAGEGTPRPFDAGVLPTIKKTLYTRFLPLRLGADAPPLGVWRGYHWIPLDRALYDFLHLLISYKGHSVDAKIANTSKSNLHTLTSRLRKAIEPDVSRHIYIKNVKGEGYWVEHFIP